MFIIFLIFQQLLYQSKVEEIFLVSGEKLLILDVTYLYTFIMTLVLKVKFYLNIFVFSILEVDCIVHM